MATIVVNIKATVIITTTTKTKTTIIIIIMIIIIIIIIIAVIILILFVHDTFVILFLVFCSTKICNCKVFHDLKNRNINV